MELHGFLSYLIKCNVEGRTYEVYGYKGKQVRDNIHAFDVATFMARFLENPGAGAVYNLGGGRENSISILEAFQGNESISGKKMKHEYVAGHRSGDHICYIYNLRKMKKDYPEGGLTRDLDTIFEEIYMAWDTKAHASKASGIVVTTQSHIR